MQQQKHWNQLHKKRALDPYSNQPSAFAKRIIKLIPKKSKLLELGCGVGNDSVFFADTGHKTQATDFSQVVIDTNMQKFSSPNLKFAVLDITKPFPFPDNTFDTVYARLSLHYFRDKVTKKVFREIARVLKPSGLLIFMCKTTSDELYGQGVEIEKDMFELDGHIRHFFTKEYARECLKKDFLITQINQGSEQIYSKDSDFIEVIAKKNEEKA